MQSRQHIQSHRHAGDEGALQSSWRSLAILGGFGNGGQDIQCMKVVLKVLSTVLSGEPAGTRTQGPRLKRATPAVTTEADRVRPIDTIPLKSYTISFLPL
jgi:hypothetical protein